MPFGSDFHAERALFPGSPVGFRIKGFNRHFPDDDLQKPLLVIRRQAFHHALKPQQRVGDHLLVHHDAFAVIDVHGTDRSC
jgi:hypothetical protein